MKPVLTYTLLRIALFLVCFVVIGAIAKTFLTGQGPLIAALIGGAVVSSALSLKFLNGPREEMARRLEARMDAAKQKLEDVRSKEDDD